MDILERLGLKPKPGRRARRAGLQIKRQQPKKGQRMTREEVLTRVGIFGVLLVITLLTFPGVDSYEAGSQIRVGDIWQREEVIAPFKFPVLKSEDQIQAERDSIRFVEPPIFAEVTNALARTEAELDTLGRRLDRAFQAYVDWQQGAARGQRDSAREDSARYFELQQQLDLGLTNPQWDALLQSYAARAGLAGASRVPSTGPALDDRLLRSASQIAAQLIPYGVLDVPADSVVTPLITVVNRSTRRESDVQKEDVYGIDNAFTVARNELAVRYPNRPDTVAIGVAMLRRALVPSLQYLEGETALRYEEARERISENAGLVQEGQSLVRRGDRVTPEIKRQLESLARIRAEQTGNISPFRIYLGQGLLAFAAFLIFFLYLYLMRRQIYNETRYLLLIAILFAAIVGFFGVAVRLPQEAAFAVPVALASILLTVMFDSRVGMFATVTLACLGGLVFGYDFQFTFATVVAGMFAVFSVRDVRNRSQIIITAGLVFASYLVILGGYALLRVAGSEEFLQSLFLVGINAGLLLLAYPLLWVFERTFGVTTDLTLLELSDTNRPLLKELSLRAPGTFNHSLQVANLAEAAADAVGANTLLTRIGALYHDIGKMLKPEYYIENQQPGDNPHDRVTPYMSALIIASHVKDGLELGKEYNLPEGVLNFIPTHHGTTLMEFFYRKAKELRGPEDPPVDESEFRYPGPRPQTNEQGIVMLADSVEAASRSLEKPTPKRLESLVDAIFRARIEDGQLDGCALTFADLNRIKETFLAILAGIYHFRVKYPDQDKITEEEATTEPPETDIARRADGGAPAEASGTEGQTEERPEPDGAAGESPNDAPPSPDRPAADRVDLFDEGARQPPPPTARDEPSDRPAGDGAPPGKHVGPSSEERASLG